jgi:hypothetical protein
VGRRSCGVVSSTAERQHRHCPSPRGARRASIPGRCTRFVRRAQTIYLDRRGVKGPGDREAGPGTAPPRSTARPHRGRDPGRGAEPARRRRRAGRLDPGHRRPGRGGPERRLHVLPRQGGRGQGTRRTAARRGRPRRLRRPPATVAGTRGGTGAGPLELLADAGLGPTDAARASYLLIVHVFRRPPPASGGTDVAGGQQARAPGGAFRRWGLERGVTGRRLRTTVGHPGQATAPELP